ncbi:cbb3-type cytochrome c oxidase subunit I [Halorussus sp. MSC15.2]|uniref:cbb3-type cytochrome c oxidase subunit I n=1 Tax=Halorussus sp. MSC15.2 TaxID=2283638 RepID=UPI0013D1F691|nr:cbb3-type cytochrome c oxidase subunit I [Halorussus sp. MSC15.2]NEU56994.1 cytochrome-c oxidase [Halorussus sp. MSC15.2]
MWGYLLGLAGVVLALVAAGLAVRRASSSRPMADGGFLTGRGTSYGKAFGVARWLTTLDHKDIGLLYIVFGVVAGLWGGIDAMMIRTELVTPPADVWDVETYNELFTTHGITMLFLFVTPVFTGIANYFVPLLVGADDMAFPRINAIAFWLLPPSLLFIRAGLVTEVLAKVLQAGGLVVEALFALEPPAIGWTMYTPMSIEVGNPQVDVFLLGLHLSGVATTMGAINLVVTVFTERAEDVEWADLDIFSWAIVTMSGLILFAFPILGSTLVMLLLDRNFGTTFFLSPGGGPLLYQHLFWFFGHPEVYIIVLPAFGLISLILPKFVGRRLFGFTFVVYSTLAIGVLSFGVWAHHMFTTGIDPRIRASFMAVSVAIAVPSAVKVFNWLATLWYGRIRLTAPVIFLLGGISIFIVGGVTGVFLASIPVDLLVHGTYYVVGHFHLILMGIIPFTMFAASYYWFPLLTGRMYNRRLARVQAVVTIVGGFVAFLPMMVLGMEGLPRRYAQYPPGFTFLNQVSTLGAYLIGAGVVVWLYNVAQSLRVGPRVEDADVWDLKETDQFSREWQWFERRLEERRGELEGDD